MTLLNSQYHIDNRTQESIPAVDLEPLVKSQLLQEVFKRLAEREDLLESEHHLGGSTYKLNLHVFSEAELTDYRNSVINEFMVTSGMFTQRQQQDNS